VNMFAFARFASDALRSPGRRRVLRLFGSAVASLPAITRTSAAEHVSAAAADQWESNYPEQNVWGYADKHSVTPGEPFDVMLSSGPRLSSVVGRLEFRRVGVRGERPEPVWVSPKLAVKQQVIAPTAAAIGTGWEPVVRAVDTADWKPGIYSADFVFEGNGFHDTDILQIILRNPAGHGDVLLKLGTNTYQAYNKWGGHSLYPQGAQPAGAMVSFDRPGIAAFFEYDIYLVSFLEELVARDSLRVDYISDFDLHTEPALARGYRLLVSSTHDEYWTKEMFDAVEHRIHVQGGNTAFFGANAAYCQVRYADVHGGRDRERGRQLVCFKSMFDPIARRTTDPELWLTTQFRTAGRRPETMLMGVAYQSWFEPETNRTYPYRVIDPRGDLYAGTGWKAGDIVADVVGYEWDNRDPDGDGRRLFDSAISHIPELSAERLTVLFEGAPVDVAGKPGRAEAIYFVSRAGAKVFSSGSIRWAWGLNKPGFAQEGFRRFNENLLRDLLQR
jgi:hypothetical protein